MTEKPILQEKQPPISDVVISGAGLVGGLLALVLDRYGFKVTLIDQRDWFDEPAVSDGRASAIAEDCWCCLELLGLTSSLGSQQITGMRIGEAVVDHEETDFALNFDANAEVLLGHMVENERLMTALNQALKKTSQVQFLPKNRILSFRKTGSVVDCELATGENLTTRLLASAEGRGSVLRGLAGIKTQSTDYDQAGLVCTVSHEFAHEGLAYQWFLPNGSFAVLPLPGNATHPHLSSIVWSEKRELAKVMMELDETEFTTQMQRRFGNRLGKLKLQGKRWSFPLAAGIADCFAKDRFVLVGDAAHHVHPLAGQGLNLGIRDVAALAEVLVEARRLGLDFGDDLSLDNYQRRRRFDSALTLGLMDGLNRVFSTSAGPARMLTSVGLPSVNRLDSLKAFLIEKASGKSVNQPRLLQGLEI